MTTETYNGWKNYETWNVVHSINNSESLIDFIKNACNSYQGFKDIMIQSENIRTYDGVRWDDERLDYERLEEVVKEIQDAR